MLLIHVCAETGPAAHACDNLGLGQHGIKQRFVILALETVSQQYRLKVQELKTGCKQVNTNMFSQEVGVAKLTRQKREHHGAVVAAYFSAWE